LAFSYWIDIPWFRTERKLAAIFIKPSLGVPNWSVIYFINYTPTSSLALFNTAPSNAITCYVDVVVTAAHPVLMTELLVSCLPVAFYLDLVHCLTLTCDTRA
jgi:hypothetical protein